MKTRERVRRWAAALLGLALLAAAAPVSALAAENEAFVSIEDTVEGDLFAISGGGDYTEPLRYDVPEGGLTALIFFGTGCGNCRQLFQTIAQGALSEDPRVNIAAVSLQDREATREFADLYMGGRVSNVYYSPFSQMLWDYAELTVGSGSVKTAFVLLISEVGGGRRIVWYGQGVHSGWAVQEAVNKLLDGGSAVRMTKTGESAGNGEVWLAAGLRGAADRAVSGTLYAAGYEGERLTEVQSRPLALPAGGSAGESFTVRGETAKLFCLEEGTLRPLAAALTAGG